MKKVLFVLVIMMSVFTVNAQTSETAGTKAKPTHAVVQVADLQKAIKDNIAKDYAGYTIKSASSVTVNNALTYRVVVTKGSSTETLIYDNNGAFVKMLPKTVAMHHAAKKK